MTSKIDGPRIAPARGNAPTHLVVLLHGYGADGQDLIGLAPHWQRALPTVAFAAPNAPDRCPGSPGYQWFPITRLDPSEMARGIAAAAPGLNAFLDAELQRHGLPPERLALVGFSQGTMLSLHVGLSRSVPPAAIVGFSGLLADPNAVRAAPGPGMPVLLVHGTADELIPDAMMLIAAGQLAAKGLTVQWHRSLGVGHGIDPEGLAIAGHFLAGGLAGRLAAAAQPPMCLLNK